MFLPNSHLVDEGEAGRQGGEYVLCPTPAMSPG